MRNSAVSIEQTLRDGPQWRWLGYQSLEPATVRRGTKMAFWNVRSTARVLMKRRTKKN